jgi:(p)ppGpp synthase/HD superfamily hydrolase
LTDEQGLVEAAKLFATLKHTTPYGDKPYTYHLEQVANCLTKHFPARARCETLAAAWLHDTLEDTETSEQELQAAFGEEVAHLVSLLKDKPGANRAARHAATYPLRAAHPDARAVKIADRIANTEESLRTRSSLLSMYRRELQRFCDYMRADDQETQAALIYLTTITQGASNV